jgi:two-component system KDP operon response regulator KdpE
VKQNTPDFVILDLGLPDIDGFQVLERIRHFSSVPIIVLTIRGEERDVVKALGLGASDYITKPFRHLEFVARIRNTMRKKTHLEIFPTFKVGDYTFQPNENKLFREDKSIRLTNTENKILQLLAENSGKVVTISSIARALWDIDYTGASKSIYVYIRRLREKIEADANCPKIIISKPNVGYFLVKAN